MGESMKLFDITKELFSTPPFEGDPEPRLSYIKQMRYGDEYNLSFIALSPHNSTHADAPKHFLNNGKTIEKAPLHKFIGKARVVEAAGELGREEMKELLQPSDERLLIKGDATITKEGAKVIVNSGLLLIGVAGASVANSADTVATHRILLQSEVAILENLYLDEIVPDCYFLMAQPLKWAGVEASPVRAVLMKE